MATVTGFEGLRHPRKSDLKQFSELFEPLFLSSSEEARRQAAAALSQCLHVPQAVARLIGSSAISIAAIFLTRSEAISDATLVDIIRTQSSAHATAIARRNNLSVQMVDALVERRDTAVTASKAAVAPRQPSAAEASSPQSPSTRRYLISPTLAEQASAKNTQAGGQREEQLRNEIKALVRSGAKPAKAEAGLGAPLDALHGALMVRFARSGEVNLFAAGLADALSAGAALSERILLDISGQQMAVTLTALSMNRPDSLFVLFSLYPHLTERSGGASRGEALMNAIDPQEATALVRAWIKADSERSEEPQHQPVLAADRPADPRETAARPVAASRAEPAQKQRVFGRGR